MTATTEGRERAGRPLVAIARRATWWVAGALAALLAILIVGHFVFGLDAPPVPHPATLIQVVGINDTRVHFVVTISAEQDVVQLQVGGTRVWLTADQLVIPGPLVGVAGAVYVSVPLNSLDGGWAALAAIDADVDFVRDMRECTWVSAREAAVIFLVTGAPEVSGELPTMCGRGIYYAEPSEPLRLRVNVSTVVDPVRMVGSRPLADLAVDDQTRLLAALDAGQLHW